MFNVISLMRFVIQAKKLMTRMQYCLHVHLVRYIIRIRTYLQLLYSCEYIHKIPFTL